MLYLLDSNVLITANATYYECGRIPQFWEWIAQEAMRNIVKLPVEILRETHREITQPMKTERSETG